MEPLKHECGVAMIRLLKPLEYYQEKYGTWMYGLNKLYLMMEKQHNRGQEGAGLACVKLDYRPGHEYMFRERAEGKDAITKIFGTVQKNYIDLSHDELSDASFANHITTIKVVHCCLEHIAHQHIIVYIISNVGSFQPLGLCVNKIAFHLSVKTMTHIFEHYIAVAINSRALALSL